MSLATDVWNELKKLREHKAFYAAAGAGDVAVETVRELPERLGRLQNKADLAALSGRAVEYVILFGARAVQTYDELAERGREVVGGAESHHAAELQPRASSEVSVPDGKTIDTVGKSMAAPASKAGPAAGGPGSAAGGPGSAAGGPGSAAGGPGSAAGGPAGSAGSVGSRTGSTTRQGAAKPGRSRGKSTH